MPTPAKAVQLIVLSDDFGICHAVNAGIVQAFTQGILTCASVMVPCPWFYEAAALARQHRIPIGIHYTLTCDWEYYRWGPITHAPSLVDRDGFFSASMATVKSTARPEEVLAELAAQTDRLLATGINHTHFDYHMGSISTEAYNEMVMRYGKRSRNKEVENSFKFDSMIWPLTQRGDFAEKKRWLLDQLANIKPGVHLLGCHCGQPGPELASVSPTTAPQYRWAEEFRASDLAVLIDPNIRAMVKSRGILLRSFADAEFPS